MVGEGEFGTESPAHSHFGVFAKEGPLTDSYNTSTRTMGRAPKKVEKRNSKATLKEEAEAIMSNTLPTKSGDQYKAEYSRFCAFQNIKENRKTAPTCEHFLSYFQH